MFWDYFRGSYTLGKGILNEPFPYCFHKKDINRKKLHHFLTRSMFIYLFLDQQVQIDLFTELFPSLLPSEFAGLKISRSPKSTTAAPSSRNTGSWSWGLDLMKVEQFVEKKMIFTLPESSRWRREVS